MSGDSDKLLYIKAVKWITENPKDNSFSEKIKRDFLNFSKLSPENKAQLILDLNELKTGELPEVVERALPWLTFDLNALPDYMVLDITSNESDRRHLGSTSKRMHSLFQLSKPLLDNFLQRVSHGEQDKVEALFTEVYQGKVEKHQEVLRYRGRFTDYSGRTFYCSAYEYAYWAKDTHMCRLLERYMDDDTKAAMAARIDEMERIDETTGQPVGLVYSKGGQEHRSAHFDFTPLIEAYGRYLADFYTWSDSRDLKAMAAAWSDVGKAQRNVPAHVAQEYCRRDRSFYPRPEFNDATFPRVLTFYNLITGRDVSWFPLITSSNSGLGFNFAVLRSGRGDVGGGMGAYAQASVQARHASIDLAAITHLDEVRTAELTRSREHLNPPTVSHGLSM